MSEGFLRVLAAFFCVAAAGAAVAAVLAARARRRPPAGPTAAPTGFAKDPFADTDADALRGDPRALKPGEIAEIRGRSYAVRGSLYYRQGASSWAEHLLDDAAGGKVWLSVEEDPDLELALWHQVPSATVAPGPPSVDFDGRRYFRDEAGSASYTGAGSTGLAPAGRCEYQDYAAPDGALLSFERYAAAAPQPGPQPAGPYPGAPQPSAPPAGWSDWEVARGERLHRAELQIFAQGA